MDKKIENKVTVIVLEILGILGVENIIETLKNAEGDTEEKGYFIINYLFKNMRKIKPQLEELINELVDEEVNIIEGISKLKDDEEVVSFFTKLLSEVMQSV